MLLSIFGVFCAAELFRDVQPLVQSALDGYNVSILAYGQTHSGKTHTMVALSLSLSFVCDLFLSMYVMHSLCCLHIYTCMKMCCLAS